METRGGWQLWDLGKATKPNPWPPAKPASSRAFEASSLMGFGGQTVPVRCTRLSNLPGWCSREDRRASCSMLFNSLITPTRQQFDIANGSARR